MVYLDNIFLIGTTNILQVIDPAILRLGCIETVIKIELPDMVARSSILLTKKETTIFKSVTETLLKLFRNSAFDCLFKKYSFSKAMTMMVSFLLYIMFTLTPEKEIHN